MKKKVVIILIAVMMLLLAGCESAESGTDGTDKSSSKVSLQSLNLYATVGIVNGAAAEEKAVDISLVNENLSLGEALNLFGEPRPNEFNSIYPLIYAWDIDDEEILYMVFKKDDEKEFREKIHSGAYILPDEPAEYTEDGFRILTDNELKVIREWVMTHTPVRAYTVKNHEETVLFDLQKQ
jgi:hypothetical protein